MTGVYDDAIAKLAAKKSKVERRADDAPSRTYIRFDRPRQLEEFVTAGQIDEGCEPNGTVLSWQAVQAMNAAQRSHQPCEYLAVGEERFSDGRHFLDLGMNPAFIEATSDYRFLPNVTGPVLVCPECDGRNGDHQQITIPDRGGGKELRVKCPRDHTRSYRR